uniref:Uncharacterized protein n=1 Tax=Ananas comosus var. bracteatus TaxID=296719 RepID=A0A6V7PUW1_ANACO|nr:unnamed protein product [Ananas comosus var. bracteatus]
MEPGPSADRPRTADAFLSCPPPPARQPSLSGTVAKVDIASLRPDFVREVLPGGLVARFEGSSRDYKVASFRASAMAVFFPSWVSRESAIGHSPSGLRVLFSIFPTRRKWGNLRGDIFTTKRGSDSYTGRSCAGTRKTSKLQSLGSASSGRWILSAKGGMTSPSSELGFGAKEDANPILLGEGLDEHLGIETMDTQEAFIRQTGFQSIPSSRPRERPRESFRNPLPRDYSGVRRRPMMPGPIRWERRPDSGTISNPVLSASTSLQPFRASPVALPVANSDATPVGRTKALEHVSDPPHSGLLNASVIQSSSSPLGHPLNGPTVSSCAAPNVLCLPWVSDIPYALQVAAPEPIVTMVTGSLASLPYSSLPPPSPASGLAPPSGSDRAGPCKTIPFKRSRDWQPKIGVS